MNFMPRDTFRDPICRTPLPPRRKPDDEKQQWHLRASRDVLTGSDQMIVEHVADDS
jgi:hypothetical protein